MYKAIFIDIDDTLRDSNRNISDRNIEAIREITNKGILVILCSGRPRKYTENISKDCFASHYVITSGGGDIYDYKNDKTIFASSMDKQACKTLYNIAIQNNIRIVMHVGEMRVSNRLKHLDGSEQLLDMPIDEFLDKNNVVQCVLVDDDFKKIKNLRGQIEELEGVHIQNQAKSLVNSNLKPSIKDVYYDITNIEVSKGNGIIRLCEYLNIDLKDTIGIGDDYNDISMFKVVGYTAVMGNANDQVKKYADEILEINDNDGVAIFLERLIKTGNSK